MIAITNAYESDNSDVDLPNSLIVEFDIDGYKATLGFSTDATLEEILKSVNKHRTELIEVAKKTLANTRTDLIGGTYETI